MQHNFKTRHKLSDFGISMESIDFQHDNFGSQMEVILFDIEKFLRNSNYSQMQLREILQTHELLEMLENLIMKRLGLNVKIYITPGEAGACRYLRINLNHIFIRHEIPKDIKSDLQDYILNTVKNKPLKGTIDLKNAVLTGIFSEFQNYVEIDLVGLMLNVNFTAPIITAIILHELGHIFNYFVLADRLEATNNILASLSKEIKGGNNSEKIHVIFKDLTKQFGIKDSTFDDLLSESNSTIIGVKLFNKYIKYVKSQLPNSVYNDTINEALADNFASRFGYGRQLILSIDRFNKGEPEKNNLIASYITFMSFITNVAFPSLLILGSFIGGVGILGVLISLFVTMVIKGSGEEHQSHSYDTLKTRYQRIRQQYIEMIKTQPFKKEELRAIIDDIHFVDNIIQETYEYRGLYNRMANIIFTSSRNTIQDIETQKLVAELSSNNLFLKSAELKVLS